MWFLCIDYFSVSDIIRINKIHAMSEEYDALKRRIGKLEQKGAANLWLQFFVFPLILAGMGYYFQNMVKNSEKRMEQLKITQSIVDQVFYDTVYERTVAMRGLLNEVLENDDLADKIGELIDNHLKQLALNGTPEEFKNVTKAVENFATETNVLKQEFLESPEIQTKLSKYDQAQKLERDGFNYILAGDMKKAEAAFNEIEEIYPSYHQAYEISRYLKLNSGFYTDPRGITEIQRKIVKDYTWKAPQDLVKNIERKLE